MTNRLISLTVGTEGAEEWFRCFQDLSELATNLGAVHHYVNVASSVAGEDEEPTCDPEGLYHDEFTVFKVHQTIMNEIETVNVPGVILSPEEKQDLATAIINKLQNAGILFRERPKKS